MQTLTVAIGAKGIDFFTKHYVTDVLANDLKGMKFPDHDVPGITEFTIEDTGSTWVYCENLDVKLTNGKLQGFDPAYQGVKQQSNGTFTLTYDAVKFTVPYTWTEKWDRKACTRFGCDPAKSQGPNSFDYNPSIGKLDTTVTVSFAYDSGRNSYDIKYQSSNATPSDSSTEPPGDSVIQHEKGFWGGKHLNTDAVAAIGGVEFAKPVQDSINPMLASIPASGKLTDDITFDFAVGDSKLAFPGDNGITIGVTGEVAYKGTPYPGPQPTALPVPTPPVDDHHVEVYVSDYTVSALHWAYWKAGKLDLTLRPSDLPDPDSLKVKTYVTAVKAFKPYAAFAMTAQVTPVALPQKDIPQTYEFAQVHEFTQATEDILQKQLPSDVYALIKTSLDGNAYTQTSDLTADLRQLGVAEQYDEAIEKATRVMGMVVTQNLEFALFIEDGKSRPQIVFDLLRTDVLQNLALGRSGNAQTMQYDFHKVTFDATLKSTTVPGFDKVDFGGMVWPIIGEPRYDEALQKLGKTGVALPIVQDFTFLFEQAQLSIQEHYVSVLADVAYKNA
ncbi:hypothetical protein [Streptomyces sp. NEAU-S7GS2]|uniref:hypothetical protein n=1 Tax=Streptomyces sp. NEAU-S7GS2 TaxID=2202000 RepID=UPI000D6F6DE9|nr:hypothetical protein [Streptomyces sp. NEAU-S7GS2]AWN31771.1 hypothetical protein DKG71_42070 [Streptomyces sp. NEAU-S7GS2]